MGGDNSSYSYRNNTITIDTEGNKLVLDSNSKRSEYLLDSIYRIILTKSKISLRFLFFGIVIGFIGVVLFAHGLMLIYKGGFGETVVGLIFIILFIVSFKIGVITRYSLVISSTKGNKNIKFKKSPELVTFINNANSVIKKKHPSSDGAMLAGSSNDYFVGKP